MTIESHNTHANLIESLSKFDHRFGERDGGERTRTAKKTRAARRVGPVRCARIRRGAQLHLRLRRVKHDPFSCVASDDDDVEANRQHAGMGKEKRATCGQCEGVTRLGIGRVAEVGAVLTVAPYGAHFSGDVAYMTFGFGLGPMLNVGLDGSGSPRFRTGLQQHWTGDTICLQ